MNVRTKLSRALWLLLIVCGIFMIGSLQVDAAGQGQLDDDDEYTIVDWRKVINANYNEPDFYNIDVLCSSSTRSSNIVVKDNIDNDAEGEEDSAFDGVAAKCSESDNTIHRYYTWKVLDGAQPFTKDVNEKHSSFSQTTYLFNVAGAESQGWKEYTGADIRDDKGKLCWRNASGNVVYSACDGCKQGDGTIDQWDSTNEGYTKGNIQYVMVYLHRMSKGFDLYENFRTEVVYDGKNGTNYDNVSSSSIAYFLTNNNTGFKISNTLLYYNTVPHVLGTEGDKTMIIALMDEGTGRPVPVVADNNTTGLASIRTFLSGSYEEDDIAGVLQGFDRDGNKYFPYYGDNINSDYTTITEAMTRSYYTYNAFSYYYTDENGNTRSTPIDTQAGLHKAITAANGPQYIATVEIALNEAITQRNSAYAFMSAYGTNGGNYNTAWGNTHGNNLYPEATRGQYWLSSRASYYYLNGSTNQKSDSFNIIKIRMRSVMTDASYWYLSASGNVNPNGINRNFKHSFTTYTRSACFTKDGKTCYQRVMFNYFNDIELHVRKINDKSYFVYELVPKTADCEAVCGASGCSGKKTYCTLTENNGFSTFYYSEGLDSKKVTYSDWQKDTGNGYSTTEYSISKIDIDNNSNGKGKFQYSNAGNAWGVWRQIGWSNIGSEIGGGFAADTRAFPMSPDHVQSDFSSTVLEGQTTKDRLCRFAWSERYYYNNESTYNVGYIEEYVTKTGGNIDYDVTLKDQTPGKYNRYEEMTDTYLTILRTFPDMLIRTFEFADIIGNKKTNCSNPYPNNHDTTTLEEKQIGQIITHGAKGNYDAIASKLCENFGFECSNVAGFRSALSNNKNALLETTNPKFESSYLAIVDALKTKDENNITYAEHMAYAYFNFYVVIGLPDEYTVGSMFACRNDGRNYGFEDILLGDKSNIIILNEETRLNTPATGNVDENGNSVGTNLESVGETENGKIGPSNIGTKYGPELYLINESTGGVYVPELGEDEMTCPSGYEKDGDKCKATYVMSYNRYCEDGYVFDFTEFKCTEIGSGVTHCPDGYQLEGDVCISYDVTNAICDDGYWDPEKQVCLEYTNAYCKSGYTLTDVTEANKLAPVVTYTFARGNGDFNKFTGSGIKNFRQDSDSTISYDLNSTNGYIEITGLNLDPAELVLRTTSIKYLLQDELLALAKQPRKFKTKDN